MLQSLKAWLLRRHGAQTLIESGATALIERFGDVAYLEARLRQHDEGDVREEHYPAGHRELVKEATRRYDAR